MYKYQKQVFIAFSVACLLAIFTCVIVDFAINGRVTWAFYPTMSVPLGWLVLSPLLIRKHGVALAIGSLTVFVLPFLFLLDMITPVTGWFAPIGIPSAFVGMVTVWVVFLMFRFLKINSWYKSGITVFLVGVLANTIINYYINIYLYSKPEMLSTIISGACCVLISVALFVQGYRKGRMGDKP